MSKKTQKGGGIWKKIKSMISKTKSQTNNNNKPLINNTQEKLEDIGKKANELLIKLEPNEDRSVLGIKTNESILEGIKEICKEKDKDKAIKELKELKKLEKMVSKNENSNLEQWNQDIEIIKKLIKKLKLK